MTVFRGPIEDTAWPAALVARVSDSAASPTLHGYAIETDLARHYRFGETMLLALTGVAPTEADGTAFEVAMIFASATDIRDAPVHAAALARLCGARPANALATGLVGLVEQARFEVASARPAAGGHPAPTEAHPAGVDATGGPTGAALAEALAHRAATVPHGLSQLPMLHAILAVLREVGLRSEEQLIPALVLARLAPLAAEASAASAGKLRDYPMDVPPFQYEPPR